MITVSSCDVASAQAVVTLRRLPNEVRSYCANWCANDNGVYFENTPIIWMCRATLRRYGMTQENMTPTVFAVAS